MAKSPKTPKVGILVECGRDGLEVVLCRRICALLRAELQVLFEEDIVPMDNKPRLLEECGAVVRQLLYSGCARVVILWDERPAWPKKGEELCWHNDRAKILSEIQQAEIEQGMVHLVCIEREFESWLLHDAPLLCAVLSTQSHKQRVKPPRNPHRIDNPKGVMMKLFKKHGGGRYVDVQAAPRFAKALENLTRLRRCDTFCRFAERVTGKSF